MAYYVDITQTHENEKKQLRAVLVDYAAESTYKKGTDITSYLLSKLFPIEKLPSLQGGTEREKWCITGRDDVPNVGIDPLHNGTGNLTLLCDD